MEDIVTIARHSWRLLILPLMLLTPSASMAAAAANSGMLDLTSHWVGYASLATFFCAYLFVMLEEFTRMRKSKPVMLAAGIIWGTIAWVYEQHGIDHAADAAVRHNLLEYAELMLFLLVAMTYINSMEERNVFDALRSWLVRRGFSFRRLFWITGLLAFCISPLADNLTTALLMCAVVMAVGGGNDRFILLSCINIVVAANAGGAFSPFGDITTLMVWQREIVTAQGPVDFWSFFNLFIPSLVNWIVPALMMTRAVPDNQPHGDGEQIAILRGGTRIILLFLATIATSVSFHHFLHLPPVIGMLTGLAYLQLFGYYLKITSLAGATAAETDEELGSPVAFDIFRPIARAEWDTLFFFYGVVLCVGGLGFIGYLGQVSEVMYSEWGATAANVSVGLLSALIDNIPVMFAVLTMMPEMSLQQWLLVTLTAGIGGSLLSIGSAAGVALMGQSQGKYTFFGHLKWTPVVALGYAFSILAHLALSGELALAPA
jgi:NhaD family Na+/H+ antiporter